MKLINIRSRRGFVNLFADFILTHLDYKNKISQIQVTDCQNFLVLGGKSEFSEILNITKVKDDFISKFGDIFKSVGLEKLNIIDLIQYDKSPVVPKSILMGNFYNTDRPMYMESQITSELAGWSYIDSDWNVCEISEKVENERSTNYEPFHISSEFPYGFSLNNSRNKLYYSEYVSFNLFSIEGINKISLRWENDSISLISDSFIDEKKIESIMKDVFNFDLTEFSNKIKNYDILEDIIFPKFSKPWLVKDKVNDLYII